MKIWIWAKTDLSFLVKLPRFPVNFLSSDSTFQKKAPRHRTRLALLYLVICGNPMLLAAIKGAELDHLAGSRRELVI